MPFPPAAFSGSSRKCSSSVTPAAPRSAAWRPKTISGGLSPTWPATCRATSPDRIWWSMAAGAAGKARPAFLNPDAEKPMTSTHDRHRPDLEAEDMAATARQLERDLLRRLNQDSIVLDIGANRGQFAEEILALTPVRTIYSFEPVPDAHAALSALAASHPSVVPVCKAVSTTNGTASFFVTASDVGSSLLAPLPGQPSKWLTVEREVTVETQRLDDFIRQTLGQDGPVIDLLKSDAQGADLDVIRSA